MNYSHHSDGNRKCLHGRNTALHSTEMLPYETLYYSCTACYHTSLGAMVQMVSIICPSKMNRPVCLICITLIIVYITVVIIIIMIIRAWSWKKISCSIIGDALSCDPKFNPLNTKRRLLYLKTKFVPRSKHFSSRL